MKKSYSLLAAFALLAALVFTACPSTNGGGGAGTDTTKVDSVPPAPGHDYGGAVITLEREVCFGRCPSYTLKIEGNGKVSYEGRQFVAVTGAQSGQVSPDSVKVLVDEFFKMDYFALPDSFDSQITDVPHYITSISIDGKYKRVFDRDGAPAALHALEDRIDQVAGSGKWVVAEEK